MFHPNPSVKVQFSSNGRPGKQHYKWDRNVCLSSRKRSAESGLTQMLCDHQAPRFLLALCSPSLAVDPPEHYVTSRRMEREGRNFLRSSTQDISFQPFGQNLVTSPHLAARRLRTAVFVLSSYFLLERCLAKNQGPAIWECRLNIW